MTSLKRYTWLTLLLGAALVVAGAGLVSSCSLEMNSATPVADFRLTMCTSVNVDDPQCEFWLAVPMAESSIFAQTPSSRAPSAPCPAIAFGQALGELITTFDSAGTTVYTGVLYRQTDGNFTGQGFSIPAPMDSNVATNFTTVTHVQDYFPYCRGIPAWTPAAHPTLLADMPGTMSRDGVVTYLGGAPYAEISVNGLNITVSLDTQTTMGKTKTDYEVMDPISLLVADFNGDGKRDVAVLNRCGGAAGCPTGSVQILLGNGDGTLRQPANYLVGATPSSMTWFDFNHDSRADLAVVNQAADNSATVQVLMANSDGSLRTSGTYNLPGTSVYNAAIAIVAADFDGDGKADLMVSSWVLDPASHWTPGFTLLHGNGDGTFQVMPARTGYTHAYMPQFLVPGDFNKDSKMDLAALNSDGTVAILLNAGDGSFPTQSRYVVGTPFSAGTYSNGWYNLVPSMFAMDFNDDGNLDLVLANGHPDALYPNPMFITVLLGKGDGTFLGAPAYGVGIHPAPGAIADFNGDGRLDLVVGGHAASLSQWQSLWILPGQAGGFGPATEITWPSGSTQPTWVTTADLNGDGHADLVAIDPSNAYTWLGNGDGTFQTPASYAVSPNATSVIAADVNGDSRPDLILAYGNAATQTGGATPVLLLTAKAGGGFNSGVAVATGNNTLQVALADVNGDGKPDLVAANFGYPGAATPVNGNVSVSLGNGDGTFKAPVNYTVGLNPTSVAVADVNGDGKPDLIVGTLGASADEIAVLLGNGNGTFGTPIATTTYSFPGSLSVADFDGDGKLDVAILHRSGDSPVSVMQGNGDGTFQPELMLPAGDQPSMAIAADFTGDGRPDLAVLNPATSTSGAGGSLGLFRNTSTATACTYSLGAGSQPVAAAGGTRSFQVIAGAGCQWVASSSASWIALAYPSWGSNSGSVNYSVTANTGAARSGTITVGGQTFAVNQSAGSVAGVPQAVSVDPAAGTGSYATYTFSFSDSAGWQNISVANVLINNFINGIGACYVAVVPSSSSVFLVDDAGDAGGPYQGMVLPGSGTVQNSQCSIAAAGSSIAGGGNTLTVALAITFKGVFAGNKVMYLSAREAGGANSGWQALGTCGIPGSNPTGPAVGGVTPARSSGPGAQTFAFTFTDTNGWQDLGVVNVLINDALNGNQACYLAYSRPYNVLYLVNDAGSALSTGLVLNGSGSVGNSQCTVSGAGSSASGAGNTLTLTLNLSFSSAFAGNRVIYAAARSNGDALNSGWQAVGSRTVQ